jgi:hypothetical protein
MLVSENKYTPPNVVWCVDEKTLAKISHNSQPLLLLLDF